MRSIFITILFLLTVVTINAPTFVHAQATYNASVGIPGSDFGPDKSSMIDGSAIGRFIAAFYKFAWPIAGVMAIVIILAAGLIRIVAGGDTSRVEMSKEMMWAGMTGLGIVLCAWVLLNTISPDLVKFKDLDIKKISNKGIGTTPSVELTESGEDPAKIAAAEASGAGGNNSAGPGKTNPLPNGKSDMPQAAGNFLGYKPEVQGGSDALKTRADALKTITNDPTKNPHGLKWKVSSMNDGRHKKGSSHGDNRALDIVWYAPTPSGGLRGLDWTNSGDKALINEAIGMERAALFNTHNEYDPANWARDENGRLITSGVHIHSYVNP